jgi:hypothetical protein
LPKLDPQIFFNREVEKVEKVFMSFKTIRRMPSLNDRTLKLNVTIQPLPSGHCEGPYRSFFLLQAVAPKQSSMKDASEFPGWSPIHPGLLRR